MDSQSEYKYSTEYSQAEYKYSTEYTQAEYKYSTEYTQAGYKYSTEHTQDSLDSYEYGGGLSDDGEVSYRLFNAILWAFAFLLI